MSAAAEIPLPPQLLPQTMGTSVAASQSTFAFWFGIAKSTGSLLLSFVVGLSTVLAGYFIGALTWLLTSLYAVVSWPVLKVYAPLRFLLSPITYTLSYVFGPLVSLLHFIGRLRLGSAAFLGIVTGLILRFVSSYFFVILSLDGAEGAEAKEELESDVSHGNSPNRTTYRHQTLQLDNKLKNTGRQLPSTSHPALSPPRPAAAPAPFEVSVLPVDTVSGSQDDVWKWLQEFNPTKPTMATETEGGDAADILEKTSAQPGGLLALTILEESTSE
ncbi:hypothetical protein SEPCBS57363_000870 [Sporothrix epigloea]|uniref:Uncharacterized protein n=1 Tax=Sporothrix epigloea TaxID=1892477 RepID=A0ABP0D9Q3_9PEZI